VDLGAQNCALAGDKNTLRVAAQSLHWRFASQFCWTRSRHVKFTFGSACTIVQADGWLLSRPGLLDRLAVSSAQPKL